MARKDDLKEEAEALGIELTGDETVAELEGLIAQTNGPQAAGEVKRTRVSRGSRRRIERALASLNKEMDAAIKEFDLQAFVADGDGKRIDEWSAVTVLSQAKAEINDLVNALLAG
jgi:hypothetical protein